MAAAGAAALPFGAAPTTAGSAKYRRYNLTSPNGQKALASYARGVEAMLKLPADHPQNWFRDAFIHFMDCPHKNWWFYVWHRGYTGYFEETIRNLSGDPSFAMPYWDWTILRRIPDPMFDGVLNPQSAAFEPYTRNLAVFTSFLQPALRCYWKCLSKPQRAQLAIRGYPDFDSLWNDVIGLDATAKEGISSNISYATTCGSRYLTRDNPDLDRRTAAAVSKTAVILGLLPKEFYNDLSLVSFTSSRTPSHHASPLDRKTSFSLLEYAAHNKVHNYIGGVGRLDPGPYGNMTNFLSPVDPIFFLHHSNIDRLWDVWTRKQKRIGEPDLPSGEALKALSDEPFLFYVDANGHYVGARRAGEYLSIERFEYDYEPGFGEEIIPAPMQQKLRQSMKGEVKGSSGSVDVPRAAVNEHLSSDLPTLLAEITLARPHDSPHTREYDVLIGAPAGVTDADAGSPYYAGTLAFFGFMRHEAEMPHDTTFVVPVPQRRDVFPNLEGAAITVDVRIVPAQRSGTPAPLKALTFHAVEVRRGE